MPESMHDRALRRTGATAETIYGVHAVEEALGQRAIDHILIKEGPSSRRVQEIINRSRTLGVSVRFAPRQALERAAGTAHHQDVVAVCSAKAYVELESLLASRAPLLVALDGVEDPRNLGAVARAAVAAGIAAAASATAVTAAAITRIFPSRRLRIRARDDLALHSLRRRIVPRRSRPSR